MQVSVITPVYNAATFVTRAVESALQQPETAEVILVEDGSPDNSLEVCQRLAARYDKVHLFRHPNGENRGAGASRNLGMKNASCEYIGFVDADNFYLPGRFSAAKVIFESDLGCEGVYEAIGMHVEDDASLHRWIKSGRIVKQLTTLTTPVKPELLAEVLISGECGHLTLDGLVLKRSVLDKSGYMVEELRLHQDTEFIIRVAIVARLLPARMDVPVAMQGVHDHNRISSPRSDAQKYADRMAFWIATYRWCKQHSFKEIQQSIVRKMILDTISIRNPADLQGSFISKARFRSMHLSDWFHKYPEVLFDPILWHSLLRQITSHGREI